MKIIRILSLFIGLAVICPAWAAVVSESEAQQVANRFMAVNSSTAVQMRLAHRAPSLQASGASPYYIFNADRPTGGYVIIAGDDRVPAVLGYSDDGTFDMQDIPEAMQNWLDDYAAQIAALDECGAQLATHITSAAPISPMLKACWSQNAPFNTRLPIIPNGNHAYVGCVATAMAQVMHYWKWPQRPRMAIPTYTTETQGYQMPSLLPIDFNWNVMQDTYLTDDTASTEALAAADLSLYCAQSVRMDYKKSSSSATTSDIPMAAFLYFNYSPATKYIQRKYFTTEQWEQILLDELVAQRPVIYNGRKETGGHAFICDGYDGNGMFHFNWGWNSKSNGYFLLNVLNPDLQGTGSASGTYGYIINQGMITGFEPGSAGEVSLEVYNKYIEVQSYNGSRNSVGQDFSATVMSHFVNCSDDAIAFDFGWGLYQDGTLLRVLLSDLKEELKSGYYFYPTRTLNFGSGISSGTYRIVPIFSEPYANDWKPCIGSDIFYLEVVINGNNCTIATYGDASAPDYLVNNISVEGHMHPNRPVDITLDLTNQGNTRNDLLYMFANGQLVSMGYVDLEKEARGLVPFRYVPETAGAVSIKFSYDDEGSNVFATSGLTIQTMPTANLTGTAQALNVSDAANKIITANEFGVQLSITNVGETTYDEDISIKLYKRTHGTTGTLVQALNQRVMIPAHRTTTVTFHLDNVMDGWRYFAKSYFYSNGEQMSLANVSTHTIVFPAATVHGDVNVDGEVTVADINAVIDFILKNDQNPNGDVNGDGEVTIADINAIIDLIINH